MLALVTQVDTGQQARRSASTQVSKHTGQPNGQTELEEFLPRKVQVTTFLQLRPSSQSTTFINY